VLTERTELEWNALDIGPTILSGTRYNGSTDWPEGFKIPVTAVEVD